MYPRPYLAPYLPTLLELTLPGLDANDVFKTKTTLQLFHIILSWMPVLGRPVRWVDCFVRSVIGVNLRPR